MTYKGYSTMIQYNQDDACLVGRVIGITDVIGFHGDSIAEMKAAFEEAIDDYLETCQKLNRDPSKPFSGRFNVRLEPQIHAKLVVKAAQNKQSLNQFVRETLERAV
jgi:predicted HicB family RNase H-like nuclease